jgi:hypothetical protein
MRKNLCCVLRMHQSKVCYKSGARELAVACANPVRRNARDCVTNAPAPFTLPASGMFCFESYVAWGVSKCATPKVLRNYCYIKKLDASYQQFVEEAPFLFSVIGFFWVGGVGPLMDSFWRR